MGKADEVVFNVAAMANGMGLGEEADQGDLQTAKLIKNEPMIGKRDGVHELLESRLEDAGGGALHGRERGAIVGAEFRQDTLRQFQGRLPLSGFDGEVDDVVLGGELAVERILFRARKILLVGRGLRIVPHPIS